MFVYVYYMWPNVVQYDYSLFLFIFLFTFSRLEYCFIFAKYSGVLLLHIRSLQAFYQCWYYVYIHRLGAPREIPSRQIKQNTGRPGCEKHWHQRLVNTLRPRQNGRHFADDTFNRIFLNENVQMSLKISLKFVPKALINNIPALLQIMACRLVGTKPLSKQPLAHWQTRLIAVASEVIYCWYHVYIHRAVARFALSQWETALLCNDVYHWLRSKPKISHAYTW